MAIIEDGEGSSRKAFVDDRGRLLTDALTDEHSTKAVENGTAWNIHSGTITLTSGNESGLLYMKNTGSVTIIVNYSAWLMGTSTGAAAGEYILCTVYRNPTTGTLISGGTAVTPVNKNFGAANIMKATVLKGVEGSTITDGINALETLRSTVGTQVTGVVLSIPQGSSIALSITPFASNTSMPLQAVLSVYEAIND